MKPENRIVPQLIGGQKYHVFTALEQELYNSWVEQPSLPIIVVLDLLKKTDIRGYITHVVRPFLIKNSNVKFFLKVESDRKREIYLSIAIKALNINHIRYTTERYLMLQNFIFGKQSLLLNKKEGQQNE